MRDILEKLARGLISVDDAEKLLRTDAIGTVSRIAKLDVNREVRKGIPEIVLAEHKSDEDLSRIALRMLEKGRVIVSRAVKTQIEALRKIAPADSSFWADEKTGIVIIKKRDFTVKKTGGRVGILAAGTADIPVAEEARVIAEEMGCEVSTSYDVGVAGIHRLFPPLREMIDRDVDVIVVVAGMEGALPSVVSGLVDVPVIGVPTSVGYGFGEGGVGALAAMLQACSLGLAVVNIDSGVAAGIMAVLIANRAARSRR